jgi:hypothetical protein
MRMFDAYYAEKSDNFARTAVENMFCVMNTLTLGYENDTRISKREIATLQLCEAIALFLIGRYVCAITLAGAAEAVLAGLLAQRGELSVTEDSTAAIQTLRGNTGLAAGGKKKRNELFNDWNAAKNRLKHHNKDEEETLILNLFDEAYWMIKRAAVNAEKLKIQIKNRVDFENWIVVNINM